MKLRLFAYRRDVFAWRAVAVLSAGVAACAPAYKPVHRVVRRQDVNLGERTKLTSRFVWDDGETESTIPGQSPEVVTDEAQLGVAQGRLCVHVTLRTGSKHDAPFGEWAPHINGEPVYPEAESVTHQRFQFAGQREVVGASFLSKVGMGGLSIKEAAVEHYAVVTRSAWFCPTQVVGARLEMKLQRAFNSLTASEGFIWDLMP